MKRPPSHVIDEQAMRIFGNSLPPEWVVNPTQRPDYGKDYLVEIVEQDALTGINFFAQVKGTTSAVVRGQGRYLTFRLQRKHAAYYVDKVLQPVFLVLIDVTAKIGYWLFIQQYLRSTVAAGWRDSKTSSVRFPTANTLADSPRFSAAVKKAQQYMAALRPAAISEAITARKHTLESLDPRVNISICASDKQERYTIQPKEPFNFTLRFTGQRDAVEAKLRELLGRGLPVSFSSSEISASGSQLMQELFKSGGTLEYCNPIEAEVTLTSKDASGNAVELSVPAIAEGGTDEFRINGELKHSPLTVASTWNRLDRTGIVTVGFLLRRWCGQPVRLLSHFDRLARFLRAADSSQELQLTCLLRGNQILTGPLHSAHFGLFKHFVEAIEIISRARTIAEQLNLDVPLPIDFGPQHLSQVDQLHSLLQHGQYTVPAPSSRISFGLADYDTERMPKLLATASRRALPLLLTPNEPQSLPFLGTEVQIDAVEYHFSSTRLDVSPARLKRRLAQRNAPDCQWTFVGTRQCRLTVRRVNTLK